MMLLPAYRTVRVSEDFTRSLDGGVGGWADPSKAQVLDAVTARILTTTVLAALNALNSHERTLAA